MRLRLPVLLLATNSQLTLRPAFRLVLLHLRMGNQRSQQPDSGSGDIIERTEAPRLQPTLFFLGEHPTYVAVAMLDNETTTSGPPQPGSDVWLACDSRWPAPSPICCVSARWQRPYISVV